MTEHTALRRQMEQRGGEQTQEVNTPRLISHGASVTGHLIGSCQVSASPEHDESLCCCAFGLGLIMQSVLLVSKRSRNLICRIKIPHLQVKDQIVESFLRYAVMEPHCGGEKRQGKREKKREIKVIQLCKTLLHCTRQPATLAAVGNCVNYEHQ